MPLDDDEEEDDEEEDDDRSVPLCGRLSCLRRASTRSQSAMLFCVARIRIRVTYKGV